MGYYLGCVQGWLLVLGSAPALSEDAAQQKRARQLKSLQNLKAAILKLDYDPTKESMTADLDGIRAKFKVLSMQLGVSQKYLVTPEEKKESLSF